MRTPPPPPILPHFEKKVNDMDIIVNRIMLQKYQLEKAMFLFRQDGRDTWPSRSGLPVLPYQMEIMYHWPQPLWLGPCARCILFCYGVILYSWLNMLCSAFGTTVKIANNGAWLYWLEVSTIMLESIYCRVPSVLGSGFRVYIVLALLTMYFEVSNFTFLSVFYSKTYSELICKA